MSFISKINAIDVVARLRDAGQARVRPAGVIGGKTRIRHGKTYRDRTSGSWKQPAVNKQKPIRCTSSNRLGGQDNRGPEFWCG